MAKQISLDLFVEDIVPNIKPVEGKDYKSIVLEYVKAKGYSVVHEDGSAVDFDKDVKFAKSAVTINEPEAEHNDNADAIGAAVAKALGEWQAKRAEEAIKNATLGDIEGGETRNDKKHDRTLGFKSFGEQLDAVRQAGLGRSIDARLTTKAPLGLNETTDSQGGFLLAPEYSDRILEIMHGSPSLLSRTDSFDIQGPSVKIRAYDETSRATGSRRGGVRGYWVAEAGSATSSKPKFREINMSPHKLAVLVYATEELLADGGAMLEQMVSRGAAEEINFLTDDAILNGDGAGKPFGIINAACTVSVAKETGQAAATIVPENIVKMFARLHPSARANAVWLINQDTEPQLHLMNSAIGTGGQLVYMPPGGLSQQPYATLYGKPVIATEFNATLGTTGDIVLADLKQYLAVTRGAIQSKMSMHVQFLTDEMAYKFTFRVDGAPWWNSALTPFKGSATQSPFVKLDTRS